MRVERYEMNMLEFDIRALQADNKELRDEIRDIKIANSILSNEILKVLKKLSEKGENNE